MHKLLTLVIIMLFISTNSMAATNISGQIRTNTTWTKAGSPYLLTSLVEVDPNVTLTIDAGVIVDVDIYSLNIHGNLIVNATSTDSVIFTTDYRPHGKSQISFKTTRPSYQFSHCKFENVSLFASEYVLNFTVQNCNMHNVGIYWEGKTGGEFVVMNNNMRNGVVSYREFGTINKLEISGNVFYECIYTTIYGSSNGTTINIKNNQFLNNLRENIDIASSDTVIIADNIFYNNLRECVRIKSPIKIHDNIFAKNEIAIQAKNINSTQPSIIEHNNIYDNKIGIQVYDNTSLGPNLTIKENCIYNNSDYNIYWGCTHSTSIGSNWWGTTDTAKIEAGVFDYLDDFKIGTVQYKPYLTQKHPGCKYSSQYPPTSIQGDIINPYENHVTVSPNPFNKTLTIDLVLQKGIAKQFALYSIDGRKIVSIDNLENNFKVLNTSTLGKGVYIYKVIYYDNSVETGKVIKQ